MAEVKLPFNLNPLLNTYLFLAHPLGIISGNIPDQSVWFSWIVQKYINCIYYETPKLAFTVYSVDQFFVGDNIIEQIEVKLDTFLCKKLNLSETSFVAQIKKALAKGLYIRGLFNERYISAMPSYNRADFAHDYLIYGYSDDHKCFYAAGYVSDGHYKEYKIPYSEYYQSILQPFYREFSLQLMRFNAEKTYETNYSVVIRDLKHYLSSTAFKGDCSSTKLYGLSVWYKLLEFIAATERIDLRFTKIFMEHHKLMHMRLDYLSKQGIIQDHLSEQYVQAKDQANQAYLLSMKYNLTQRQNAKNSCIALIENVIELDKVILPDVIFQIEKNTNAE